jgi:hypothetical protein
MSVNNDEDVFQPEDSNSEPLALPVYEEEVTPVEPEPAPERARRKFAKAINPAPDETEPRISRAKFAKAAKKQTEENGSASAARGTQTSVPMMGPNKKWWVRCHPDPEQSVSGLTLLLAEEDGNEVTYVLDPNVAFPDDLYNFTSPAMVVRAITSQGNEFLWLTKQSAQSPKASSRACQAAAKKGWIQTKWNAQLKGYTYVQPNQLRRDPEWSKDTIDELLEKAIGDKYIDRVDHPVVSNLLYPMDDSVGMRNE